MSVAASRKNGLRRRLRQQASCVDAHGQARDCALCFGFVDDSVEVREDFFDGHGIDLAARIVALFDNLLEVAAGDLDGELIGNNHAGAFLLLDPGDAGQGDPHGAIIYIEADIHGIGVTGGDGNDVGFPAAMQVFAGPAVDNLKFFVHVFRVVLGGEWGKPATRNVFRVRQCREQFYCAGGFGGGVAAPPLGGVTSSTCFVKSKLQGRPKMPAPSSRLPVPLVAVNFASML